MKKTALYLSLIFLGLIFSLGKGGQLFAETLEMLATTTPDLFSTSTFLGTSTKVATSTDPIIKKGTGGVFIKKVGSDLMPRSAPAGYIAYDDGYSASGQSQIIVPKITAGDHTANISVDSQYEMSYATCQYVAGDTPCTIINRSRYKPVATTTMQNGYYSVPLEVEPGMITKVVFRYVKPKITAPKTGVRVHFVGPDSSPLAVSQNVQATLVAIPNQKTIVSTGTNPKIFALPSGILGYSVTNTPIEGYAVSAGVCQYSGALTDCTPTTYTEATCINGMCSVFLPYVPSVTQKIVYKYDVKALYSVVVSPYILMTRNASTTIPVTVKSIGSWSSAVSLGVSGLPEDTKVSWDKTVCLPQCVTYLSITTSSTTPIGVYPVTITGNPLGQKSSFNLIVTEEE